MALVDIQQDWDYRPLHVKWGKGPDDHFLMVAATQRGVEATAQGARGRVLEVAAADASHACLLAQRGLDAYVIEPSPAMLLRAKDRMAEFRVHVKLVRGIAEALPFPDDTFDRVLLDSAIDHLADPEQGIRELARVLKPDGSLVLSYVNYDGLTVQASRSLYRVLRTIGLVQPGATLFWDSPVPSEHTFECTPTVIARLCSPYLEHDRDVGVSLGWQFPGWGWLLDHLPRGRWFLVRRLDAIAQRAPTVSDFVVSVWRKRPPAAWPRDTHRVRASNPVYRRLAAADEAWWAAADFKRFFPAPPPATQQHINRFHTGDPNRSWITDLIARGPFQTAAMLGCDTTGAEDQWVAAGGGGRLDLFESSARLAATLRRRLSAPGVRIVHDDLNFLELPAGRYDVVWSTGLHRVTNLESLCDQVARALRPGGLFAYQGYVGEPRLQYTEAHLARVNEVLARVPVRYRLGGFPRIERPAPESLSPFHGVRANEILEVARARFDVVHEGLGGFLFPLGVLLDWGAIEREDPALHAWLSAAEADAAADRAFHPCGAYAVFRRRA